MGLHPVLRCCDVRRRKPYFLYGAVSHFANTEQSYSMHYFFIRPLQCSMKYSTCKTLQLCKTLLVETSSYEFIFYNTRRSKGPNPHCRYYNRLLSCFWKPCTTVYLYYSSNQLSVTESSLAAVHLQQTEVHLIKCCSTNNGQNKAL